MKFKPGDIVVCIDTEGLSTARGSFLAVGAKYRITICDESGYFVDVESIWGLKKHVTGFYARRFRLYEGNLEDSIENLKDVL